MMKSESEATLTGDTVPPYLRAYGSTYRGGRFGQQYKSIGNGGDGEEQQGQGKPGGGAAGLFVLRRALGALAVFVGFAVAVSSTSSRWPTGEWRPAGPGQGLQGITYREMFEVRSRLIVDDQVRMYQRRSCAILVTVGFQRGRECTRHTRTRALRAYDHAEHENTACLFAAFLCHPWIDLLAVV